jgi:hypothetical protein
MANGESDRNKKDRVEERGYQPPTRPPRADADPEKVETGYVPPARPVKVSKKKG